MSSETGEIKLQVWGGNTCFRMFFKGLKDPFRETIYDMYDYYIPPYSDRLRPSIRLGVCLSVCKLFPCNIAISKAVTPVNFKLTKHMYLIWVSSPKKIMVTLC